MSATTLHRVEGVGRQLPSDHATEFNPMVFEQAIHGLQKLLIDAVQVNDEQFRDDIEYDPNHEETVEDGQPVLRVQPDTLLDHVCNLLIPGWDASIVTDLVHDNNYIIRTSLDCGGGALAWANFYVSERDGMFTRFTIGHTAMSDFDDEMEVSDLSKYMASQQITYLTRELERAVERAYARTIPSAATAFDYIATKEDIPPSGGYSLNRRQRLERFSQKEWAEIRGKTQQTVSDNVRAARDQLPTRPTESASLSGNPALEELDPDGDDTGDIRLV